LVECEWVDSNLLNTNNSVWGSTSRQRQCLCVVEVIRWLSIKVELILKLDSTLVTLWLVTLWHWPTIMSQVSFFFLFHNIFLFLCTRVTLWMVNVTNHNVAQVLSLKINIIKCVYLSCHFFVVFTWKKNEKWYLY